MSEEVKEYKANEPIGVIVPIGLFNVLINYLNEKPFKEVGKLIEQLLMSYPVMEKKQIEETIDATKSNDV